MTSGAYGHCVDKSLAAGYVPSKLARDGEEFAIDVFGVSRLAIVRAAACVDPQGLRLRG